MLNLGTLFYRMTADTKGLKSAERDAKRFATNTEKNLRKTSAAAKGLAAAFVGIVSFEALRRLTLFADRMALLEERLKTATRRTGDYLIVQKELLRISQKNGSALATNVALFQDLSRIGPDIGRANDEILQMTDTLNQLAILGGSSRDAINNAMLQFTQGLAGGVFRAEEFNSIIENTPEIAQRIAQGLGKSVGELRKLVLEGKLLSEDVFTSLLSQADEIEKEFNQVAMTIDRGWTIATDGAGIFLNKAQQVFPITKGIGENLASIGRTLSQDFSAPLLELKKSFRSIWLWLSHWEISLLKGFEHLRESARIAKEMASSTKLWKELSAYMVEFRREAVEFLRFFGRAIVEFPLNMRTLYALAKQENKIFFAHAVGGFHILKAVAIDSVGIIQDNFGFFFSFVLDGIANLIQKINSIPGISIDTSGLTGIAEELRAVTSGDNIAAAIEKNKQVIDLIRQETLVKKSAILEQHAIELDAFYGKLELFEQEKQAELVRLQEQATINDSEFDQQRKHYARMKIEREAALADKRKKEALSAFLGIDLTRKANELTLEEQATGFKNQLDLASQQSREFFEIKKAMAIATALIEAPKAVLSAYTFGTSIGGPILGAVFGGIAAAATATQISAIQSANFGGGRLTGGEVGPNSMYRVNEGSGAELLTMGGKDYLMTGNRGGVVTPSGASGTGVSVQINNYAEPGIVVETKQKETPSGLQIDNKVALSDFVRNIIRGDLSSGNGIHDDFRQSFGLSRA